jgi:Family of unknown function (DUF6069)
MRATHATNAGAKLQPAAQPQPAVSARRRPVWLVSAAAGAAALVVTEVFWAAARLAGVPIAAAGFGQAKAQPVTVGLIAMGIFTCAFWGTVLAVVIARYATRPARAYLATTMALTAASLVMPLSAADTATSTKFTLAAAHVLAAAIIIPVVTRRLARR